MSNQVQLTGKKLLKSYVALISGNTRTAAKMFASLKDSEGLDEIMDGVGQALNRLQAMEEDVQDDDLDIDELDLDDEDEDEDDDMDVDEDEDEEIEVPASVVKCLRS